MAENTGKKRRITLVTRLGYGAGNLVGSGALAISASWLTIFYTTYCGLTMAQATFIYSFALIADVVMNPIAGFLSDAFNNTWLGRRFGRRRFFILLAVPVLGVLNPLMWIVIPGAFWYYFVIYLCYNLIYTMVMIPYDAIPAEMTADFKERTYMSGLRSIFGKGANFLTASLPGIFFVTFGEKNPMAFFYMGLAFGVIMALAMLSVYLTTWERPVDATTMEKVENPVEAIKKLFVDIFSTLRIRTFRHLLGMYLFGFGAEWLFNSTFSYYVIYVLMLQKSNASWWQSLSPILQVVSTVAAMALVAKIGFRKPYIMAECVIITCAIAYACCGIFHLDAASAAGMVAVTSIVVVFGLGTGAVYYIPWQTYLFVADADEIVTGRRREGTFSAAMHLCGKLMNSAVVAILGISLSAAGFIESTADKQVAAVDQPAAVHTTIILVLIFGVGGLSLLGMLSAKLMRMDKKNDEIAIAECARIANGGRMEDVDPEVKRICEELTGVQYEICFGHNTIGYHTPEELERIKAELPERRKMNFGKQSVEVKAA
ncbi:MFS transporter [Bifidobacterium callimiconis]|uniref:MFS transporter n=1 Tax=Bifidobacterium callimiconis TaxID=2306973 RepID=UPI001BDD3729|nr:MFS transporter [Bifidobacterium callimiconis]MBT1176655.1 MFS transporter [Bifidobacterium callimiconis]